MVHKIIEEDEGYFLVDKDDADAKYDSQWHVLACVVAAPTTPIPNLIAHESMKHLFLHVTICVAFLMPWRRKGISPMRDR